MIEQVDFKKIGTIVKILPFNYELPERITFISDDNLEPIYNQLQLVNSSLLIGSSGTVVGWDKVCPNNYENSYVVSVQFANEEEYIFLPEDLEVSEEVTKLEELPDLYEVSKDVYKPLSLEEKATAENILIALIKSGQEDGVVEKAIDFSINFHDEASHQFYRQNEKKLVKKTTK